MKNWIRRALTRKIVHKSPKGKQITIIIPPNEKLVYGVKFAISMTICLSALEIAHMAFLRRWNSEAFAAITGLIGTISGILISQKT